MARPGLRNSATAAELDRGSLHLVRKPSKPTFATGLPTTDLRIGDEMPRLEQDAGPAILGLETEMA
jgi:hypothetical protein